MDKGLVVIHNQSRSPRTPLTRAEVRSSAPSTHLVTVPSPRSFRTMRVAADTTHVWEHSGSAGSLGPRTWRSHDVGGHDQAHRLMPLRCMPCASPVAHLDATWPPADTARRALRA